MKKVDISKIKEAGEGKRLPAGGYICKYTFVEDKPEKEYLYMEFDIAKGEFAGYYQELADRNSFWSGRCYRSYKEKALPMFKRMCTAVSKSNNGYVFDGGETNGDENTLVNKLVGIILAEEEYVANDGSIKRRLYVARECSVEDIEKGNYKVPAVKLLKNDEANKASLKSDETDFMDIDPNKDVVAFH